MTQIGEDGVPFNGRADAQVTERTAAPAVAPAHHTAHRRTFTAGVALNLLALAATIILLSAGLALAGALMWPKTYAARAEVLYPITQEQPTGFLREDRSLTTQLVLLRGRAVLTPIAAQQGRSVEDLQQHLDVTVQDSSEIIQVQVTDRAPQRALQTAQAVVNGYLALNQAGQPMLRQRLEAEMVTTNTALADAQARLAAAGATATAATVAPLQSAVQAQQSRQQQLQAQLDVLNLAPVAQLLTPPYAAGTVSPRPAFAAVAGALVGLVLAAVVIAVMARAWARSSAGSSSRRE
jgi:capsular polysaccharide biosynthesis protein